MALSEYMPYGAPELLEAAPARMARSTLVASLAVALAVAAAGALLGRQVPAPGPEPEITRGYTLEHFLQRFSPPSPPEVAPAAPRTSADPNSLPVPRPDDVVPVDDFTRVAPPDGRPGEGPVDGRTAPGTPLGDAPGADPLPGEFVWVDEMPVLVSAAEARYPDLGREAGVEGTVTVQMLVGLDGRVLRAVIAPHGSVPMLDDAALDAARTCVFTPALANGHPVKVWVSRQYRFRLH